MGSVKDSPRVGSAPVGCPSARLEQPRSRKEGIVLSRARWLSSTTNTRGLVLGTPRPLLRLWKGTKDMRQWLEELFRE